MTPERFSYRKRDGVVTTGLENGVPLDRWLYAIMTSRSVSAFGSIVALVDSESDAKRIVAALNRVSA